MGKIITVIAQLVIGCYLINLGIDEIISGKSTGVGGITATSQHLISSDSHPIQYYSSVIFHIVVGALLILSPFLFSNDDE